MVDVHAHILPDVDDGAASLADALQMARLAAADGVATIVATPHADADFDWRRSRASERLAELREALRREGVPLELLAGCEALVTPGLAARVADGLLPRLNDSRYLLVEWPLQQYPAYLEQALFDLRLRGFTPVLAHGERYRIVQSDVNLLVSHVERGMLVQVTAGSLLGTFGAAARRTAEIMLEHDLAHLVASDTHSATHRPPLLSGALARATALLGAERARALVVDVPRALVEDRPLRIPPPRQYRPRPFWAFWRLGD